MLAQPEMDYAQGQAEDVECDPQPKAGCPCQVRSKRLIHVWSLAGAQVLAESLCAAERPDISQGHHQSAAPLVAVCLAAAHVGQGQARCEFPLFGGKCVFVAVVLFQS